MNNDQKVTLMAIMSFGLEKIVKNELRNLGFYTTLVADGRVEFEATMDQIPKANLWLRTADRVLLKLAEFEATDFDMLFDETKALPWNEWLVKDCTITVTGKSVQSKLQSVRTNQSMVKKAIVECLKSEYKTEWLDETGPEFTVQISVLRDKAMLTLDTSGSGLNKRAYRESTGEAPMKETLAASLIHISLWKKDELLIDPMCGSGTILIEAAMMARNIAPGLNRNFAAENWTSIDSSVWESERKEARKAQLESNTTCKIFGYDIDPSRIKDCENNAKNAGVASDIQFEQKDIRDLWIDQEYGNVICNPPYGVKLSSAKALGPLYISIHNTFRKKKGWAIYMITSDKRFPHYFKRAKPDKIRKLFNGNIEAQFYQYYRVTDSKYDF